MNEVGRKGSRGFNLQQHWFRIAKVSMSIWEKRVFRRLKICVSKRSLTLCLYNDFRERDSMVWSWYDGMMVSDGMMVWSLQWSWYEHPLFCSCSLMWRGRAERVWAQVAASATSFPTSYRPLRELKSLDSGDEWCPSESLVWGPLWDLSC